MGKSAKAPKQQVTDYRLSIHMCIASQVDRIRKVWVNEKLTWQGDATDVQQTPVNLPYLFGGAQKEGGLEGNMWMLPGKANQVMPQALAQRLGRTSDNCPAFRGVSSVFFTGYQYGQGFKWSSNMPSVASAVWMDVTRLAKGLDPALAEIPNEDAPDAPDTNPAHIIFEVMTDKVRGMGAPFGDFNLASFNAAAQTLFDESFGMSIKWMQQASIEDFVNEILDHIQAMLYLDPETGLWTLTLLRDDYDPDDLPVIDVDNAVLSNFQRKYWGETINEITVSYTLAANEKSDTVTVQNTANAEIQGAIVNDTRDYYAIRKRSLATRVAWRDLRTVSAPLATMAASVDRSAWKWRPGKCVKVNWPSKNLFGLICRILDIDYGKPGDYDISLALTEDIFALDRVPGAVAPGTGWVDESEPPSPMEAQKVFTLPTYLTLSPLFENRTDDLIYPEVLAGVLGYHSSYDVTGFTLADDEVQPTGEVTSGTVGEKTLTERALLQQGVPAEAETDMLWSAVNVARGPRVGGFALFGNTAEATQEIGLITATDGVTWTVKRGVMDTMPRAWPAGTPVWFINPGSKIVDQKTTRSAGETVEYKLLTRTSQGELDPAEAPPVSATLTARPHLPLRPANVQVNGQPNGATLSVAGVNDIAVTWATRNRLLEDGQVVYWDAPPVSPEYRQRTIVVVSAPGGAEIRRYEHMWVENAFTMPKEWFARWPSVQVAVFAEREGFTSLQYSGFEVTGLANNPAAAEPPPAPAVGVPPPPMPMPEPGAFQSSGGSIPTDAAGQMPAIFVTGRRVNREAVSLSIRYALADVDPEEWIYHPAVTLDERDVNVAISAVAPLKNYQVEVAYVSPAGVTSLYRPLAEVISGAMVSNNSEHAENATNSDNAAALGGREAVAILDQIDATADGLAGVPDLIDAASIQASEALGTAVANLNLSLGTLAGRVEDVELDIDDPTTGLKVRVGSNEEATSEVASRVDVVEQSINTPTTGLLARAASLETATANLQTGKADASRVTTLEARADNGLFDPNLRFDDGLAGWESMGGTPMPLWQAGNFDGRENVAYSPAYTETWFKTKRRFPVDTARKYGLKATVYTGGGPGLAPYLYVGLVCYDGGGNQLAAVPGSHLYAAAASAIPAIGSGWLVWDSANPAGPGASGAPITGEGTGTWAIFPVGTKSVSPMFILNYSSRFGGLTAADGIELYDRTDEIAVTSATARVSSLETATSNLQTGKADASRVTTLETQVNTAGTGLLARTTSLETATSNLQTGKADASRVTTLESQINTAGSGLLARTTTLETATANLQTGKADASRVTTLEARVQARQNLIRNPTAGDGLKFWSDLATGGGGRWIQGVWTRGPYFYYPVTPGIDNSHYLKSDPIYPGWEGYTYTLSGYGFQSAARTQGAAGIAVRWYNAADAVEAAFGGYCEGSFVDLANVSAETRFERTFIAPIGARALRVVLYADSLRMPGGELGIGNLKLENGPQASTFTDDASLHNVSQRSSLVEARASTLETATANLQTGKADATRVTLLEARANATGVNITRLGFEDGGYAMTFNGAQVYQPAYGGRLNVLTLNAGQAGDMYARQMIPVDTSRKYRIKAGVHFGNGTGESQIYIGFQAFDGAGNTLTHSPGSYAYAASVGLMTPANYGWREFDSLTHQGPITGEGTGSWTIFPVGTKYIKLLILQNYNSSNVATGVDYIEWEDITDNQGVVSLEARATTLETATANLSTGKADASRVTALEARSTSANLLPKSQFFAAGGLTGAALGGWSANGDMNGNTVGIHPNHYFGPEPERPISVYQTVNGGSYWDWYSPTMPVDPTKWYCASAYVGKVGHNNNPQWIFIEWYIPGVGYGYSSGDASSYHYNEKAGGVLLSDYKRIFQFGQAPAGAQTARIIVRQANLGAGSTAFTLRPMFSETVPGNTQPPPWAPSGSEARLNVQEIASVDLYGRTMARWAIGAAVPGADAFIEARAETSPGSAPTSSVAIGAHQFAVYNQQGGNWKKALEVSGGNVVLTGGLQAGAFIRLGNGQGWPVALKSVDFSASDGEAVSFGTDLGSIPALSFALNNLAPLSAGETYDVRATNLTATGFTMVAKINIPATPSNVNATTDASAGTIEGYPARQMYLGGTPQAVDGSYRIRANGYLSHAFWGTGGGMLEPDEFDEQQTYLRIYAYKNSVWTYIATVYVSTQVNTNNYSDGTFNYADVYWTLDQDIQIGTGATYIGVAREGASNGRVGAVYEISDIDWQTQGAGSGVRSATPSGQKTKVTVRPQ